jgi:CO/xanthine dehydrogenase FAD-binding subunit
MFANDFIAPTDLTQACSLLSSEINRTVILAGGTDLMARFNRHRRERNETIVYLGKLGLDYIRVSGKHVIVGACATLADMAAAEEIRNRLPLLGQACGEMACPAVRNAATLGGNVANGARDADGIPALMALGAKVVVASTTGENKIPIEQFVIRPKKETLKNGGLITEFEIPALDAADKWGWVKLKQRQGEGRSIVSVAVRIKMESKVCQDVRLVLGAMAPHSFVSPAAASTLSGKPLSLELIEETANRVISETNPVSDARGSAWYRKKAAAVLVRRILGQLA